MGKRIASFFFILAFLYGGVSISGAIQLPWTGQDKCYTWQSPWEEIPSCLGTGQDGEYQMEIAWPDPRFTVNGDCVIDNLTGLMWARNGNLPNGTLTWNQAIDYANDLNDPGFCGYLDWRLPNVNELESLVNANENDSATWLNAQGFTNVQSLYYWSSTTNAGNTTYASIVDMAPGYSPGAASKNSNVNVYVWPVRASTTPPALLWQTGQTLSYRSGDDGDHAKGVTWPSPRFADHGNGTVTDNLTGLIWTQDANGPGPSACNPATSKNWHGALDYVACLNSQGYLGYTDWRLPNRKQLFSLIDRSQYEPPLPSGHPFQNVQLNCYWSSTTGTYYMGFAWIVCMYGGDIYADDKGNNTRRVWAVRASGSSASPTLSVIRSGTGSGTVTSDPSGIDCGSDCAEVFTEGQAVTLTASADVGSVFAGWSGGGCSGINPCAITLTADVTVTATFNIPPHLSVAEGTIGTEFTITGSGFGTKKGKVLIGGVATKIVTNGWADGRIIALITKAPPPGGPYDVTINLKSKPPVSIPLENAFTVRSPRINSYSSANTNPGTEVTVDGTFFGGKKGKVYLVSQNSGKQKSCKVTYWYWYMDATDGTNSQLKFLVPKVDPGSYWLYVSNKVGNSPIDVPFQVD